MVCFSFVWCSGTWCRCGRGTSSCSLLLLGFASVLLWIFLSLTIMESAINRPISTSYTRGRENKSIIYYCSILRAGHSARLPRSPLVLSESSSIATSFRTLRTFPILSFCPRPVTSSLHTLRSSTADSSSFTNTYLPFPFFLSRLLDRWTWLEFHKVQLRTINTRWEESRCWTASRESFPGATLETSQVMTHNLEFQVWRRETWSTWRVWWEWE